MSPCYPMTDHLSMHVMRSLDERDLTAKEQFNSGAVLKSDEIGSTKIRSATHTAPGWQL